MYAAYYNLHAMPFQLTPDARFFFGSKGHRKALAHLIYGLDQGEGFIVITGEVGAGKTTLVGQLLSELDTSRYVIGKIVTTQLGADDMLRMVASAFGLAHEGADKATLLRRLEAVVVSSHSAGRRLLLIVDEAQNLSVGALEELRMLSNFNVGQATPMQSLLLGQPQFRAILGSPDLEQLRQRVTASYHLAPLDPDETRAYIEHRLKTVGWTDDPSFDDETYVAIHRYTGGVPRRINTFCSRLMLYGYLEELHRFEVRAVELIAEGLESELQQVVELPAAGTEVMPAMVRPLAEVATAAAAEYEISPRPVVEIDELSHRVAALEARVRRQEQTLKSALDIAIQYMTGSR